MHNVAKSFARSYPLIDVEDIEQTISLKWYAKWDAIAPYLELDEDHKQATLIRTFQSWGIDYCRTELAEFRKFRPSPDDGYYYSRDQVRAMLPLVEDPEAWSNLARKENELDVKVKRDPAHTGDALAHYADLRIAWSALSPAEREVLRLRYVDGAEYEVVAKVLNIGEPLARKRAERALSHLQKLMGCDKRTRQVMSNAKASVVTRRDYEGE